MKGKISFIDQNHFLNQAVNMFFSAVKLGILTWGVYGTDSLLQPASSGQSMNCSFSHFLVGFTRESGRLPLNFYSTRPQFHLGERARNICMAECTAFFVTFRIAPHPNMHEFRAILAEHARLCRRLCETEAA